MGRTSNGFLSVYHNILGGQVKIAGGNEDGEKKIHHRAEGGNEVLLAHYDIQQSCMIYLLRKHDVISVPIIREAYIIRVSGYHRVSDIIRFRRERISLQKTRCKASGLLLVGEDGFEPSKRNAADLQSVPFGHSGTPPDMRLCR